jgi:alpha-galactosidase
MDVKIAVIGAGSVAWSSTLIRDLCLTPSLYGSTITLMDINPKRLSLIHGFARRYASEKAELRFERATDRREALREADFVINTAMAGGHTYYEEMRRISERHGYYRGINSVEWNMVSDYHTIWGYYQLRLMMEIAEDMEEICPDAWLLLLANPVFEGTTLLSRETKVKVIGLCHGHLGYKEVAETLRLDLDDVEVEMLGFNHLIWLTRFKYRGEDAYPQLDDWIEQRAGGYWRRWRETQTNPFDIQMSPAAVDMYRRYGLFPIGDTVRGGTWRYHWNLDEKRRWYGPTGGPDSEIGWRLYLKKQRGKAETIAEAMRDSKPLTSLLPPRKSQESVVPIIDSIANDRKALYQANILNKGMISGIPDDVAVEAPVKIDGKGVHRRGLSGLPKRITRQVMELRRMRLEWALQAFLEGGRETLEEWLLIDPRTESNWEVKAVIEDLLAMPENTQMARHFE